MVLSRLPWSRAAHSQSCLDVQDTKMRAEQLFVERVDGLTRRKLANNPSWCVQTDVLVGQAQYSGHPELMSPFLGFLVTRGPWKFLEGLISQSGNEGRKPICETARLDRCQLSSTAVLECGTRLDDGQGLWGYSCIRLISGS